MMEVPRRPGIVILREVLKVVGVGAEVGVGANAGMEMDEKSRTRGIAQRTATRRLAHHSRKGSASVAVTMDTKRGDAPNRCVAFAAERVIRLKYAPTSSPPLRMKLTRVEATVTEFSEAKSRTPSSAMHQALFRRAWQKE